MGWMMVLFAIAVGGLLIWQNLGVITLVFFGGIMTVKLPLAVWVLLFTLAGIISGLTLQFLYSFGRPVAAPKASPPIANNPTVPPPSPRPSYIQDTAASARGNDWERDSGDDWNFDTPPEKPTTIQDREEFPPRVADREPANFVKPPEDSLIVITAPLVPDAPRTTTVTSSAPAASAASGMSNLYTPGILVASTSAKPPAVHA